MARNTRNRRFDFTRLYPLLNVLLLLCVAANFIVIFFSEKSRKPQIVRSVETVTTNHLIVVTNYIYSISKNSFSADLTPSAKSNLFSRSDNSISIQYQYYKAGTPSFRYLGVDYTAGSETSYGTVLKVYPDRVKLSNGIWLVNSQKKDIVKNDRNDRISDNGTRR